MKQSVGSDDGDGWLALSSNATTSKAGKTAAFQSLHSSSHAVEASQPASRCWTTDQMFY